MALRLAALGATVALASGTTYFEEKFADATWEDRWVKSNWKGEDQMGGWTWTNGEWHSEKGANEAWGIQTADDVKFHAISAKMDKPVSTVGKKLVVQYSVKNEKKEYAFCGGGYIKVMPKIPDPTDFGGETDYAIMFGPDLCGYDVSRIHLIFNHEGENLLKDEDIKLDYAEKDEFTHLYTLVLDQAAGEYEVFLDKESKAKGVLSEEWGFPAKEIKDPAQSKPEDWVDETQIPDPASNKPEGYDDISPEVPDPEAAKPDDWDDEEDGEWEPPMIDNPEYKGEWVQEMMENPDYKGEWEHPLIPNAAYSPEEYARFTGLEHVGFELWTVNGGSIFDNIIVTDSLDEAWASADAGWAVTIEGEKDAKDEWKAANEPEVDEDAEDEDADEDDEDLDKPASAAGDEL
jgi:calreticulin